MMQLPTLLSNYIMLILLVFTFILAINGKVLHITKPNFCRTLECDNNNNDKNVCGIRQEGNMFKIKLFKNECELLKYGCATESDSEYGIVDMVYCEKGLALSNENTRATDKTNDCFDYDCSKTNLTKAACGIRNNGTGYRLKIFKNKCELFKFNCKNEFQFIVTDSYICDGMTIDDDKNSSSTQIFEGIGDIKENVTVNDDEKSSNNYNVIEKDGLRRKRLESNIAKEENNESVPMTNIIVVDAPLFNGNDDIKVNIDNFFAGTHVLDLPLKEVNKEIKETRRMHLKVAGPVKVFQPWVTIPKNISEDYYHAPTLSSCFHKCPQKCPDTYAPVCGRPGIMAREPTLVFKNHCYMDFAQCKMRWENKSPTAISSNYIESSFIFCFGDKLNGLYRFLPLIKTLQHMGRLKKKGYFRYKFRNMRFFNNMMFRQPNLMG